MICLNIEKFVFTNTNKNSSEKNASKCNIKNPSCRWRAVISNYNSDQQVERDICKQTRCYYDFKRETYRLNHVHFSQNEHLTQLLNLRLSRRIMIERRRERRGIFFSRFCKQWFLRKSLSRNFNQSKNFSGLISSSISNGISK